MKEKKDSKAVLLPAELYRRIEERVKITEFGSVEEYITFVLNEVLAEDDEESPFTEEEEEDIKKRLKDLGYLK